MKHNPERVAWTVLLSAFGTFCLLAAGLPYSVWNYVTTATDVAQANVYANLGTLVITGSPPIAVTTGLSTTLTEENSGIESGEQNLGRLVVSAPDGTNLADLTVYAQTQLTLAYMRTPRFNWSSQPYALGFYLGSGQARVQVPEGLPRPINLLVGTPFGQVAISGPGTFRIEVSTDEARVSVLAGQAVIACPEDNGVGYAITAGGFPQGILIKDKGCDRDASPIRNLIRNGDFTGDLAGTWEAEASTAGGPETNGIISRTLELDDVRPALGFSRYEPDWGTTQIKQTIDYNIVDKRRLFLQLDVRIDQQDVDACGSQGTECPIMVLIDFDYAGEPGPDWLQGFYAVDDPLNPGLPWCPGCSEVRDPEWYKVSTTKTWQTFSTGNLIEQMKEAGFTPGTINEIRIYASGHTFVSYVRDVRLLIQD